MHHGRADHGAHPAASMNYLHLAIMGALSFISMYVLM